MAKAGRPRKPAAEKLEQRVLVRMLPEEVERLKLASHTHSRSMSSIIRGATKELVEELLEDLEIEPA